MRGRGLHSHSSGGAVVLAEQRGRLISEPASRHCVCTPPVPVCQALRGHLVIKVHEPHVLSPLPCARSSPGDCPVSFPVARTRPCWTLFASGWDWFWLASDLGFAGNKNKMAVGHKQQFGVGLRSCQQECENKMLVE